MFPATPAILLLLLPAPAQAAGCDAGPRIAGFAATANAASLELLPWAPFGRPEFGWAVYAPRIAAEIGTRCPATSRGFAIALARWQRARGLTPSGQLDVGGFAIMKTGWQLQRVFVRASRSACPPPPPATALATAAPSESYGGKTIRLRADALAAWRRLLVAARRDLGLRPQHPWLRIYSGFRDPAADARRCALEGNCQGIVRARCSAHRTGLAMDIYVGESPGFGPDSTVDTNRRAMARTAAYRWLVINAGGFGFVNYAFEPWHWEWQDRPAPAITTTTTRRRP